MLLPLLMSFGMYTGAPAPSGGVPYRGHETRTRTKDEVRREREAYGILPKAAEIIEKVAIRQATKIEYDEQKRFEELARELEIARIAWEGRYLEALNARRQALIGSEVALRLQQKLLDEENTMILLVLASSA